MIEDDSKPFFSRENIFRWAPSIVAILTTYAFVGSGGIWWRVVPPAVALFSSIGFMYFGHVLSQRVGWQLKSLILMASAFTFVTFGAIVFVLSTANDPAAEMTHFLPGGTGFFLIFLFSGLLTMAGFFSGRIK